MPVVSGDIKFKRSASVSNSESNGGRMGTAEITSAVKNAVFPDASQTEREDGSTRYRKIFIHNTNSGDLEATEPKVFMENFTQGEDALTFFAGTQTDVQAAITGTERQYGCGQLNNDSGSDAMEIEVLVEDAALDYFDHGDLIRISDKEDIDDGTGNEEYVRVYGTVSYVGNVATIPLETPLLNAYDSTNTRVASVYEAEDMVPSATEPVVTSDDGTFNDGSHPVQTHNKGTIEQAWTLTFTGATAFNASGATVGSLGAGSINSDFAPQNPANGVPYFTIDDLAWGGTFVAGDVVTFTTHPSAIPVWVKRTIPAGCAAQSNNRGIIAVDFESV